ncbi:hypothetical protein MLB55_003525 [Salmonella enterica]|nr:hypothetical protein [Salmonella enterica subsp. enterica serovar Newport]EIX8421850.1 hypothetical protein [Salmonella enterica]EIR7957901.1 hypothetical protein [Salmonella enterica subsp. enterica serovar Newport]EIY8024729.1 hypothetical protein [Salmonella enterica subsp. enterica serovar Newport]EJP4118837.1 hypothetical protein [Salmonella enterica subsp. enterica serovar Newport]
MNNDFIDPAKNPSIAAQQTLIELIRAGRIKESAECFDEYKALLSLYKFIEKTESSK